jgi:crotonobetainyl-CoA:carnitine CoA-transferase CaiB-like acyl-CoA transferase
VIDQGTFITGPCCAMVLADLGADVIKVESPGTGDPFRAYQGGFYSSHFQAYNRNKRTVALDLKSEDGRQALDALVSEADVYVQNFRPDVAERLGVGAARLQGINPRLVYCAISGFGQTGPYANRATYDTVAQATSGFLSVAIDEERPRLLGPAIADTVSGIYAANAVMAALIERGTSNRGRRIEISMLEAMTYFAIEPFHTYFDLGHPPRSSDRPRAAQAHVLRSADGALLALHLSSVEKFWISLTEATGAGWLREDARFATRALRIENHAELGTELQAVFATRDRDAWITSLSENDVPFAPVKSLAEVEHDAQSRHLGLFVPVSGRKEGADRSIRPPAAFDGVVARSVRAAPLRDEQGPEIREWIEKAGGWPARETSDG